APLPPNWGSAKRLPKCVCIAPAGGCAKRWQVRGAPPGMATPTPRVAGGARARRGKEGGSRPGLAEIGRLRTTDCRQAAAYLPSIAAGERDASDRARDHVGGCLRCQAEVAAYRRLLRHLRALRHDDVATPPGALAAVLVALEAAELGEHPAMHRAL